MRCKRKAMALALGLGLTAACGALKGEDGAPGDPGRPGDKGDRGDPGLRGPPGDVEISREEYDTLVAQVQALQVQLTALQAQVNDSDSGLDSRVAAVENTLTCASYDAAGMELRFEGCNVAVINGVGSTTTSNGLGNLIVGYNEGTGTKAGSHNLIVGPNHSYASYGGLVAGSGNGLGRRAASASVLGGAGITLDEPRGWAAGGLAQNDEGDLDIDGRQIDVTTERDFSLASRLAVTVTGNTQLRLDVNGGRLDLNPGGANLRGPIVRLNNGGFPAARLGHLVNVTGPVGTIAQGSATVFVP